MLVRFLGTGTSTGVPEIGCRCEVCTSSDSRDQRLRCSVLIEHNNANILIDCSPDVRQQLLGLPFKKIDGVLITHEHFDHVAGIEDMRPYNKFGSLNIYAEPNVNEALINRMPYLFGRKTYGYVPNINLVDINNLEPFEIDEVPIIPIRVMHHMLPIVGYRINDFAYLTDLKTLHEDEIEKLKNLDTLVVSALRYEKHISHQTVEEAIQLAERIGAKRTYFTHMSHHVGLHKVVEHRLPESCFLAYDGLEIKVEN